MVSSQRSRELLRQVMWCVKEQNLIIAIIASIHSFYVIPDLINMFAQIRHTYCHIR